MPFDNFNDFDGSRLNDPGFDTSMSFQFQEIFKSVIFIRRKALGMRFAIKVCENTFILGQNRESLILFDLFLTNA